MPSDYPILIWKFPSILDKNKTYTCIVIEDEKKDVDAYYFVELLPDADVMFTPSIWRHSWQIISNLSEQ